MFNKQAMAKNINAYVRTLVNEWYIRIIGMFISEGILLAGEFVRVFGLEIEGMRLGAR